MQSPKSALAKFHELQKLIKHQENSAQEGVSVYLRLTHKKLTQLGLTDLNSLHKAMKKA